MCDANARICDVCVCDVVMCACVKLCYFFKIGSGRVGLSPSLPRNLIGPKNF